MHAVNRLSVGAGPLLVIIDSEQVLPRGIRIGQGLLHDHALDFCHAILCLFSIRIEGWIVDVELIAVGGRPIESNLESAMKLPKRAV